MAEEALARLARRYLAGHGPAGAPDLARLAGITIGAARQGLAGIAGETVEDTGGLVDLAAREPAAGHPGPTLLGAYGPLLHGWVSGDAVLGPHGGIVTATGCSTPSPWWMAGPWPGGASPAVGSPSARSSPSHAATCRSWSATPSRSSATSGSLLRPSSSRPEAGRASQRPPSGSGSALLFGEIRRPGPAVRTSGASRRAASAVRSSSWRCESSSAKTRRR